MYRKGKLRENSIPKNILDHSTIVKWLSILIIVNLIINLLFLIRSLGLSSFSIDMIINNFINGITDAGAQYNSKFQNDKVFGGIC